MPQHRNQTAFTPRIGLDKLVFSSDLLRGPKEIERVLPGYEIETDQELALTKSPTYRRIAKLHHTGNSQAPLLDILYWRRSPFRPSLRLVFRATMEGLLWPDDVAPLLSPITNRFGGSIKVAEVEFTLDLPPDRFSLDTIRQQLYCPHVRCAGHTTFGSFNWGKRNSPVSFKAYHKREDGLETIRTEATIRRAHLRRHGIVTVDHLAVVDWSALLSGLFRFVQYPPTNRVQGQDQAFAERIEAVGITKALLDQESAKEKRRHRRRLKDSPLQTLLNELLSNRHHANDQQANEAA